MREGEIMIPKVIHYCWFGNGELPDTAISCIESWKKLCPDYEIKRWDETNFDLQYNKYIQDACASKKWAFVSDVARLKILYDNGGIYLDTDVELVKPLDDLLNLEVFMGAESTGSVNTGLGCGAEINNKIIKILLDDYDNYEFDENDPVCCPIMTTKVLEKFGYSASDKIQSIDGLTIFPTEYFAPIDLTTRKLSLTKNTYSIHHYDASWQSEDKKKQTKLRASFCKYFGNRIGLRLFGHFSALSDEGVKKYVLRHLLKNR